MKKVLITGANSYIGTSFENYVKKLYPSDFSVETVDMIDGTWREKSFSGYDSVFHVAGIAHQKETKKNSSSYYKINRDLAVETAKKAKADGVKQFVFLSTMSVYGMESGNIKLSTLPNPKNNYGKSKLQAEEIIREFESDNFKVCVLRPPMVYGNGCKGNYNALKKIALKSPLFPKVNNNRSMIYIYNLCEFIRMIIVNDDNGLYYPQNSEYVSTTKMVELVCLSNGKKIKFTRIFNGILAILKHIIPTVNKAFGSLTYDLEMSKYSSNYNVTSFEDSIIKTELKTGESNA